VPGVVPTHPDPLHPGRHVLEDAAGTRLATFIAADRGGLHAAELFELEAPLEYALDAICAELSGRRVATTDERLGRALVAAGGRLARHAHVLGRDLRELPASGAAPLPEGLRLMPASRPASDLVDAYRSAFPPDHPDGAARLDEDPQVELARILAGEVIGPVLPCSRLAVDGEDRVRAAVIINDSGGTPPFGGPWIAECFRDREARFAGAGRALLEHVLVNATRDGLPAIGLAVTHGNRARELYEDLAFRLVFTAYSVDL
jgi:GNAT superfamily N-acetyltransferase